MSLTNVMSSIRVIYKQPNHVPEIKIIQDVSTLEKAIVQRSLEIIPYEKLFIICNNKQLQQYLPINIVLALSCIKGDLILVDIDKVKREFKGLSQEDILWYSKDLIHKSVNDDAKKLKNYSQQNNNSFYERDFDNYKQETFDFEKSLINVLINIELTLASIFKKEDKK